MKIRAVTVGIPVSDLASATRWYQRAFELGEPDQIPVEGVIEFDLGALWLQLAESPSAGVEGISVNISVVDAAAERARLIGLALDVSAITRFEGVVEFFELTDLDGNKIGFVTELA